MARAGLVKKKVTIQGKRGTYQAYRWVKQGAGTDSGSQTKTEKTEKNIKKDYYKSGNLFRETHFDPTTGKRKKMFLFHGDGSKWREIPYNKEGQKHGRITYFRKDGSVEYTSDYKNGEEGEQIWYDEQGNIIRRIGGMEEEIETDEATYSFEKKYNKKKYPAGVATIDFISDLRLPVDELSKQILSVMDHAKSSAIKVDIDSYYEDMEEDYEESRKTGGGDWEHKKVEEGWVDPEDSGDVVNADMGMDSKEYASKLVDQFKKQGYSSYIDKGNVVVERKK